MVQHSLNDLKLYVQKQLCREMTDDEFAQVIKWFEDFAVSKKMYSRIAVFKAKQRGWMTPTMAYFFKAYCAKFL